MENEIKNENHDFAKIFNHDTYGQVLIQKEMKQGAIPAITIKVNTIIGIAEASVNYENDITGVQKRDFEFEAISLEDIAGVCLQLREQVAEEMSQAVVQ